MSNFYSSPGLSNNPFIDNQSSAHTRYPDINVVNNATPTPTSYGGGGGAYGGYTNNPGFDPSNAYGSPGLQQQAQPYQHPSYQQQQSPSPSQPQSSYGSGGLGPYQIGGGYTGNSPGLTSQYSGSTGQQYQPAGYGGYQQQQQQPSPQYQSFSPPPPAQQYNVGYGGYSQQQQQVQPHQPPPAYVAEFDPYANNNSNNNNAGGQAQQQQYSSQQYPSQQQQQYSSNSNGPSGQRTHPRDYIRTHKAELEIWDPVPWRQALNVFDELRAAWEGRKEEIIAQLRQGGYYLSPQDGARLQAMQREAEDNIDSIAASSIQMQEVHSGYRHSTDLASKNRVREALNSALRGLPDWPQ